MNDNKERRNIELAADHEVKRLLDMATHNWKVAQSRMAQITQERADGIYNDSGVEVMAVYARMERVYACIYDLLRHPQTFLLPSVINGLRPFLNDESMDAELTRLLSLSAHRAEAKTVDFWKKLTEHQTSNSHLDSTLERKVTTLLVKHVMPYLAEEDVMEVMTKIGNIMKQTNEVSKDDSDVMNFFNLGRKVSEMAADNRPQMALALLMRHLFTEMVCKHIDGTQQNDAAVANVFEKAKNHLLESDGWHEYWANHKQHLERKGGSLDEQWKADAAEVEEWLQDMRGYIYNRWNESPEAFGQALKREQLDDDTMLLLLFYLAKKDAIVRETERPDKRRRKMKLNAFEAAMKLRELAAEKYYDDYEDIWEQIIMSENISELLMNYNSSKYNNGFNMMCLCKIVSHLQSKYKFYGSHSSEDLGKVLGDRYAKNSYDTFSNYIKKKETMLNELCFNEIEEALENN